MGASRRDQCLSRIAEIGFVKQEREASKSVVATPRSGGSNLGTRGHNASHLSFPICG